MAYVSDSEGEEVPEKAAKKNLWGGLKLNLCVFAWNVLMSFSFGKSRYTAGAMLSVSVSI